MNRVFFPRIRDPRGNLSVAENLPFEIKRVYWLYGIQATATRGGHAHKNLRRIIVAMHGNFRLSVDGLPTVLYAPDEGVLVEPMQWVDLFDFSPDAAVMVLASAEYDEADYIRNREEFDLLKRQVR